MGDITGYGSPPAMTTRKKIRIHPRHPQRGEERWEHTGFFCNAWIPSTCYVHICSSNIYRSLWFLLADVFWLCLFMEGRSFWRLLMVHSRNMIGNWTIWRWYLLFKIGDFSIQRCYGRAICLMRLWPLYSILIGSIPPPSNRGKWRFFCWDSQTKECHVILVVTIASWVAGLDPICCWWKTSCTTWDVWNPVNSGKNYQPQLVNARFLPSTGIDDLDFELLKM